MDRLLKRFDFVEDQDLRLCEKIGVAYQKDMKVTVDYGRSYFKHYEELEGTEIAANLNTARINTVDIYSSGQDVLDIGVGSGTFIKERNRKNKKPHTFGYDINKQAVEWLKAKGLYSDKFSTFSNFSMWDVLEHVKSPESYLREFKKGSFLFTSIPIFKSLHDIRKSKHYKPGEHLYYFTEEGIKFYLGLYGFECLYVSDVETKAGRDGIMTFVFRRDLPEYHETVLQYKMLHTGFYGSSAYLHFAEISKEVLKLDPKSILDYGCGRSDLVTYFWKDGKRRVEKYDPAIPQYKEMPEGNFDLVLCTDVMEHIRMADVDRVLGELKAKSNKVLFTISTRLARAKLPDGRNAHVTLLNKDEWMRWIKDVFGTAIEIPTDKRDNLTVKTW